MNNQALAVMGTAINCAANCRGSKHLGRCPAPGAPTDMLADYDSGRCCGGSGVGRPCDDQVEFEALNEDFVITPALARLLVKLARRRLDRETIRGEAHMPEMERAA
jgi:hypothetical protein